ncbi:MAG: ZIP family metal transporter, partial [Odoribacter sp.]|nr:ZIP family metal transporter [Odoribacter sp.]
FSTPPPPPAIRLRLVGEVLFIRDWAMTSLYFKDVNQKTLAVILGFVAGIMLYTAFMKLMPDAVLILSEQLPYKKMKLITTSAFFLGICLLYPLGYLVGVWKKSENLKYDESMVHYRRIAILILFTITAHSFVEGLATFLSYLATPLVAIPLVVSIIVHNFPEGMTIGVLFNKISETMGRRKAILYSGIASLFEPLGAMTAYVFILKYSTPVLNGILKAFLSGLLVATALNELIPNSQLKGNRRISVQSIVVGMFVMGMVLVGGAYF